MTNYYKFQMARLNESREDLNYTATNVSSMDQESREQRPREHHTYLLVPIYVHSLPLIRYAVSAVRPKIDYT
jgi:hypothetical protein